MGERKGSATDSVNESANALRGRRPSEEILGIHASRMGKIKGSGDLARESTLLLIRHIFRALMFFLSFFTFYSPPEFDVMTVARAAHDATVPESRVLFSSQEKVKKDIKLVS